MLLRNLDQTLLLYSETRLQVKHTGSKTLDCRILKCEHDDMRHIISTHPTWLRQIQTVGRYLSSFSRAHRVLGEGGGRLGIRAHAGGNSVVFSDFSVR